MKNINPVFLSGIRMRMRGLRAPILMSVYFLILLGIFALSYAVMDDSGYSYYLASRPRSEGSEMLVTLYTLLVLLVFSVIALMVPALNAGNIASEREKQTLDLLLSSRMSAIRVVMGKVLSNLAFIVFLLVLSLPLFTVTYLFGTIMIWDIVKTFLYLAISAYACASVATFYSALMKKTSIATILTYITLVLFVVITVVVGLYRYSLHEMRPDYDYDDGYVPVLWRINPMFAIIELIGNAVNNSNAGREFEFTYPEEIRVNFVLVSSCFMVGVSALLNVFSAVLIKSVRKFQVGSMNLPPVVANLVAKLPLDKLPFRRKARQPVPMGGPVPYYPPHQAGQPGGFYQPPYQAGQPFQNGPAVGVPYGQPPQPGAVYGPPAGAPPAAMPPQPNQAAAPGAAAPADAGNAARPEPAQPGDPGTRPAAPSPQPNPGQPPQAAAPMNQPPYGQRPAQPGAYGPPAYGQPPYGGGPAPGYPYRQGPPQHPGGYYGPAGGAPAPYMPQQPMQNTPPGFYRPPYMTGQPVQGGPPAGYHYQQPPQPGGSPNQPPSGSPGQAGGSPDPSGGFQPYGGSMRNWWDEPDPDNEQEPTASQGGPQQAEAEPAAKKRRLPFLKKANRSDSEPAEPKRRLFGKSKQTGADDEQ